MLTVTELWHYPVKSLRGNLLHQARLTTTGFEWDRHWMVVDTNGDMVTQRTVPRMATLTAHVIGDVLRLADPARPGEPCIVFVAQHAEPREVTVWKDRVRATPAGREAAMWLTKSLGVECALVVSMPGRRTKVGETAFADEAPITIASEASLVALNAALSSPVSMARFRPNVVVRGGTAWEEESWSGVRVGDVKVRTPKLVSRCSILDVHPKTGVSAPGIRAGLQALRVSAGGKVYFGVKAAHDGEPRVLALGDVVIAEVSLP